MSRFAGLVCLSLALVCLTLSSASAETLNRVYSEDFTILQYCDTVNTTAWWDTVAGEVKMLPFELTPAGDYDTPGDAWGVSISGDYAYVADGAAGLQVIDISDPTNPAFSGNYDTPGFSRAVSISGDFAYVADASYGLHVIDISDPTNPAFAGSYNSPEVAYSVAISGDYAYVANGALGLYVFDISDPTNPTFAGSLDTPGTAYGVAVSGDYACVADALGLQVIDITDPTNPAFAGNYDTPGTAIAVSLAGDHAYVADLGGGFQVIDITDPTNPAFAGSCSPPGSAYGVVVSGDYAYVADASGGLHVIGISDPTNPVSLYSYDTPGSARGVSVSGDYAYVADYGSGLRVIDIADPRIPSRAGNYDMGLPAVDVSISGDFAYVANRSSGLKVIDISDPGMPALAANYDTPGNAYGVAVSGDYAFVADYDSGFQVIDIGDPTNPTLAGSYDTPGNAYGVAISGDYAYVADGSLGLQVIDVSDPANPSLAGGYNTLGVAEDVSISGDYAYVVSGSAGLVVIDISDPLLPSLAGSYDTPGYDASDVEISGDYAYIAAGDEGLQVIDISDPTSPTLAGSYVSPVEALGVAISGDYAFVASGSIGLLVLDISDPAMPTLLESLFMSSGNAVAISGDHAYVATHTKGLEIIGVFQRLFQSASNTARSLPVDSYDEIIASARLSSTQTDSIYWELSVNDGWSWQMFSPGGLYASFDNSGTDLVWRSYHVPNASGPIVNPACTNLQIEWLYRFAMIDSIVDVPNDQGSWAYIYFTRSGYDIQTEDDRPVTEYFVFRRLDGTALRRNAGGQMLATGEVNPDGQAIAGSCESMPSWLSHRYITYHDGSYCVESDGTSPLGLPPGTWAVVGNVPAHSEEQYICLVPTIADSAATLTYSVYCISAETYPSGYFISTPDSGYSLDNLAPSAPPGFVMASATALAWDECPEEDFNYFTVYGSASPGLDTSAVLIGYTIETAMDVTGHLYDHYHVTASDFADNEGAASSVANSYAGVSVEDDLPGSFALKQSRPNPFESTTLIAFDLPEPCAVRLEVADVSGRVVRVLTNEVWPAGRHSLTWKGENNAGEIAGPGVYFVRIEAGEFRARNKVLFMR